MSTHSIADAKNKLSELIDKARRGEEIIISRHGHPVAELRGLPEPPRRVTPEDVEWLARHRAKRKSLATDAGRLVSEMRDEEER